VAAAALGALALYGLALSALAHHPPAGRRARPQPAAPAGRELAAARGPGAASASAAAPRPAPDPALPAGTWPLPAPARYDGVAAVGYPHSTLGAVALGYSALAARYTADPDVAVSVVRATALGPSATLLQAVARGTQQLRAHFGITPTGPTPTTIGLTLVACRVLSASPEEVVAGYEGTLAVSGGSVPGITAEISAAIALAWDGSDWKIEPGSDLPPPAVEFPAGPGGTTPGGWHACAEA
jgi:hypothetical protein